MTANEIASKIEEIINSNCTEVKHGGTYVNKSHMKLELLQLIVDLEKKNLENLIDINNTVNSLIEPR